MRRAYVGVASLEGCRRRQVGHPRAFDPTRARIQLAWIHSASWFTLITMSDASPGARRPPPLPTAKASAASQARVQVIAKDAASRPGAAVSSRKQTGAQCANTREGAVAQSGSTNPSLRRIAPSQSDVASSALPSSSTPGTRAKAISEVTIHHEHVGAPESCGVLTPEMREEVQAIVRAAVEQAVVAVLRKHRESEQRLERQVAELRQELRRAELPRAAARVAPQAIAPGSAPSPPLPSASSTAARSEAMPASSPMPLPQAPRMPDAALGSARAGTQSERIDVPWALDGARRKRVAAWLFGVLAVLGLGAAAAAAAVSQLGYKW